MAIDAAVKLFSRHEADEDLVFVGAPGSISGEVWLENREAEQLELRTASVQSPHVRPTALTRTGRIAHIPVPKYLRAHQRELLSVAFDLDRSTPPGRYDASVVLEGPDGTAAFPARIIVTQHYSLRIKPDELVVTAVPGGTFNGEVVVFNDGNVPIEIAPLGEFPLEDPWRAPRCCCCGREDDDTSADETEHGSEAERGSDEAPEFGVVTLDNERATVAPAAFAVVSFVGRLSDRVPANIHLRARPRIGIERFSLDVITPPGGATEPRSESSRKRSPQKRKRS